MTDSYRAELEGEAYGRHLKALTDYLAYQSGETHANVLTTISSSQERKRNRFLPDEEVQKMFESRLARLVAGDREEWTRLLRKVMEGGREHAPLFRQLKHISPFASQAMLVVSYGRGVIVDGNFDDVIEASGGTTRGFHSYVLLFPTDSVEVMPINLEQSP